MRLEDYSLDDLHQFALAESQDDPAAVTMLNDVYASLRREYIIAVRLARDYQEQEL
jgi:hypothetical protein